MRRPPRELDANETRPETLGRYRILKELGRGAMGRVFLGYDPQIDRRVAIKIVHGLEQRGDEARERFLGEARSAGKLLHPGIVTLFDAGEASGFLYLAMEHVEGQTLDAFCKPATLLPVEEVVRLIAETSRALDYAHRVGVVHRDVKPANLMRAADGAAKIMDFGLARGVEAGMTGDGALLGSPSYLAPEQVRGEPVDGRADLFSLAIVLWELLSAEKPFDGDEVSSILYRIVHEEPTPPTCGEERFPPALAAFLERALSKSVAARFPDGETFAAELEQASARARTAPDPAPDPGEIPAAEPTVPQRSSPAPFIGIIVVAILLLAAGAYLFRDRLGLFERPAPPVPTFATRVVVEPAEATVRLDGEPLAPDEDGLLRFAGTEPYGMLSAELGCRREEHRLGPADDGAEVRLVLPPLGLEYVVDGLPVPAELSVNGAGVGKTPQRIELDLCAPNEIVVAADGFHEATVSLPEGATPLEARTSLASLSLKPIPRGTLKIPDTQTKLVWYLDGKRLGPGDRELDLTEGSHALRAVNETYWIDVSQEVRVVAGETVTAAPDLPGLGTLVVLAYPPNCRVDLRRPGGKWSYLDDVPMRRKIASGTYEVRVTLKPTGEARTQEVRVAAGEAPEIRLSFGG